MTQSFDVFWSFRSPYSYLATSRIVQIREEYDVQVNVRPVYPIAVRIPGFFKQVNPLWLPYLFKDTIRIAEMEGLPYGWPKPDPIVMDIKSGEVPEEQPYIHRLTRAGAAAAERGDGLAFIDEVSKLIWSGTQDWHLGDSLKEAAARAGFDLDQIDADIEADPEHFEAIIKENEEAQLEGGHWGVPLMVFNGEGFFGQDRLSHLTFRLDQAGLKKS